MSENDVELDALDAFIFESSEQWAVAYRVVPKWEDSREQFAWSTNLCATEENAKAHAEQVQKSILHLEWVGRVDTKVVRLYPAPF